MTLGVYQGVCAAKLVLPHTLDTFGFLPGYYGRIWGPDETLDTFDLGHLSETLCTGYIEQNRVHY